MAREESFCRLLNYQFFAPARNMLIHAMAASLTHSTRQWQLVSLSKVCLKVGAQCIDAMFNFFGQGPVMRVAAVLLYRGELNPDKGE